MAQPLARHSSPSEPARQMRLAALAAGALAVGLAVYLVDRPPGHAMWIPALGWSFPGRPLGAAGDWLPGFLHVLAFALLTAAVLPVGSRAAYRGCWAWAVVDLLFEAAQLPGLRAPLVAALLYGGARGDPAGPVAAYLLRGTFDRADIAAVLAGALCAAGLIRLLAGSERAKGDRA